VLKSEAKSNRINWLMLGERIVRNDEVVGSIPTSSTKSHNYSASSFCSQHLENR
jgi:hypothetical protein